MITIDQITEKVKERFWKRVEKTGGCWLWTGSCFPNGYGQFSLSKTSVGAHRISWLIHNGDIPTGIFVCHHCDNPICIRPDHLFLGTAQDNTRDAATKGRMAKGDRHGTHTHPERVTRGDSHYSRLYPEKLARGDRSGSRIHPESRPRGDHSGRRLHPEKYPKGERVNTAKLTEDQVREIRVYFASRASSVSQLSRKYGVSCNQIRRIVNGSHWKHVA